MRNDDPPKRGGHLLPACRLWTKVSAKTGTIYLAGKLGGLRVLVMPRRDDDPGDHTHNLLIGEAAPHDRNGRK